MDKAKNYKKNLPLVSVIISSLKREKFIQRAIDSVLNQTYQKIEIIVVDGRSTDGTVEILKKYDNKIKWISEKDKGEADAYNKGLKLAIGEIVNFLPSDDLLVKDSVEAAIRVFQNCQEDIAMVNGDCFYIDEQDNIIGFGKGRELSYNHLLNYRPHGLFMPSTFIRKDKIIEVGLWDSRIWYSSDLDLWIRILKNNESKYFQKPLSFHRRHAESLTVAHFRSAVIDGFRVRMKHGGSLISRATYRELRALIKSILFRKRLFRY